MPLPCLHLSLRTARVCECLLLVHTTEFEREGRNWRLPGETGKSKFVCCWIRISRHIWDILFLPLHTYWHVLRCGIFIFCSVPIIWNVQLIVCIVFLLKGSSCHQGTYDEARHYDGRLPAFGKQGQLFPCDCILSPTVPERHGLLPWWNWKTWKGPVTNPISEHIALQKIWLCV